MNDYLFRDRDPVPQPPETKLDKIFEKIGDWFVVARGIICWIILAIIVIAIIKVAFSIVF